MMESIEEFKQSHKDQLLRHTYTELLYLESVFEVEIEYTCMKMGNYSYDVKHVIEQKMDYSIISHQTYNLSQQMLHTYNRIEEYYKASRYYLIGDFNKNLNDKIVDFHEQSDEIKKLINGLDQITLFNIHCAHPADVIAAEHYRKGLEGKNKSLLKLERELALMNGVQLLKCLIYLMDLTENKMLDIRNGITYETNEVVELVYDLNYVHYVDYYLKGDRDDFRKHVANNELFGDVTLKGLQEYYKDILRDFKTNEVGRLWEENKGMKKDLSYELKKKSLSKDQWEYYFSKIYTLDELRLWMEELRKPTNTTKGSKKKTIGGPNVKNRETMTFMRASGVLDGHLTLLYDKLIKEGWIDGNEADFKALFSGKIDEDCVLTWLNKFGRAALFTLFNAFFQKGFIIIPDGLGISSILEGHFKYKTGEWLSGLGKGNKPHSAAMPVIMECVKLLKTDFKGFYDNEENSSSVYDQYSPDMHLHKR